MFGVERGERSAPNRMGQEMPNRVLKDAICTSEDINALDWAAEVFWYRLLVQADDYGKMDARPAILRARCFPLAMERVSEADISGWLSKLTEMGMIFVYQVAGKMYLKIVSWERHQQMRAQHSKYPDPDPKTPLDIGCNQMISDDIRCKQPISDAPETPTPTPTPNRDTERESDTDTDIAAGAVATEYAPQISAFANRIHIIASAYQAQEIFERLENLQARGALDWWDMALRVAEDNNKRTWAYVRGILDSCLREGHAPGIRAPARASGNGRSGEREHPGLVALRMVQEEERQSGDTG